MAMATLLILCDNGCSLDRPAVEALLLVRQEVRGEGEDLSPYVSRSRVKRGPSHAQVWGRLLLGNEDGAEGGQGYHEHGHAAFDLQPESGPDVEIGGAFACYSDEGNYDHDEGETEEEAEADFLAEAHTNAGNDVEWN